MLALMGMKFGVDEWTFGSLPSQITSPLVQCVVPCGAKNLKIVLWVTQIPALCATGALHCAKCCW